MPPPAPGSNGTPVAERWASLPEDLIRLVSSRVLAGDLLDYVRFRAVCGSWRSATASPRGRGVVDPRFHPRRWMMLPEGHGLHPGHPHLRGYIRFLNLDSGTFVRAHLPLFSDHCVVDSVDGLLVLLRDQDSAVRLVHPFIVDIVELPPLASVLPDIGVLDSFPAPYRIKRLADSICASVSFSGVAITVMLALHEAYHIVFATPLDQQWTLSPWGYSPGWTSPFSFQGKLYTVNRVGLSRESEFTGEWESFGDIQVFQIDPPVNDGMGSGSKLQLPKLIATLPEGNLDEPMGLVECDSEILVVGYKDFSMLQFAVFKLTDLIQQRYIPITSIGGNTLFISERSLSVALKRCLPLWVIVSSVLNQHNTILCNNTSIVSPGHQQPMIAACMVLHQVLVASSTLSSAAARAIDGTKGKYSESTYQSHMVQREEQEASTALLLHRSFVLITSTE